MTWNYRVFRHEDADGTATFAVHEAFYDDGQDGVPNSWTQDPVEVVSDSAAEVLDVLAMMAKAVSKPVLQVIDGKAVEVTWGH